MPAVPACLLEPIWQQFAVLLPERPTVAPTHPLGRHRRRVPDRVVFEHVVTALVHGSGDGRIASPGRSDRTVRRRLREWAASGLAATLHAPALEQVDHMFGLDVAGLAVGADGRPCGRRKVGLLRSRSWTLGGLSPDVREPGARDVVLSCVNSPATIKGAVPLGRTGRLRHDAERDAAQPGQDIESERAVAARRRRALTAGHRRDQLSNSDDGPCPQ